MFYIPSHLPDLGHPLQGCAVQGSEAGEAGGGLDAENCLDSAGGGLVESGKSKLWKPGNDVITQLITHHFIQIFILIHQCFFNPSNCLGVPAFCSHHFCEMMEFLAA